jgi:hypothetical protein
VPAEEPEERKNCTFYHSSFFFRFCSLFLLSSILLLPEACVDDPLFLVVCSKQAHFIWGWAIVINFKEVVEFRTRGKNIDIKVQQGLGKMKTIKLMLPDYKSIDNIPMKINDTYQTFRSKSSSTP